MYASSAMSAISTEESQEAWQLAPISDESVALWELSLDVNTFWVEKKNSHCCLFCPLRGARKVVVVSK